MLAAFGLLVADDTNFELHELSAFVGAFGAGCPPVCPPPRRGAALAVGCGAINARPRCEAVCGSLEMPRMFRFVSHSFSIDGFFFWFYILEPGAENDVRYFS